MTLRARWPWLLMLFACRGDGCRCRGREDDSAPPESRPETGVDTACEPLIWYTDQDGDGYGDAGSPVEACTQPALTSTNDLDCDDGDATTWPGATPVCNDLADNDCDGAADCPSAEGDAALQDANAVLTGGDGSYFGMGMSLMDFDGDGLRDLAVSDAGYPTSTTRDGVYLVLGTLRGTAEVKEAAVARIGSDDYGATGINLQGGDLDGDGYPDLALAQGTFDYDGAWLAFGPFEGDVSLDDGPAVYLGVLDAYDGTRDIEPWVADVLGDDGQPDLLVRMSINSDGRGSIFALEGPVSAAGDLGEMSDSTFGVGGDIAERPNAFAAVGDVDADGRTDLAMDKGLMCVSFALPEGSYTYEDFCDAYLSNEESGLGSQFADAGDIDGDGYADVIASSVDIYDYSTDEGRARICSGADLTAAAPGGALDHDTGYMAEINDDQNGDNQLGHGMASPGDLNVDGYGEILISAPTWASRNNPDDHYGAAFLFYGPLEGKIDPEDSADWTITSTVEDSWFGFRALAAPADAQNNATILLSAWPFEGTSTVYQFTPGGF